MKCFERVKKTIRTVQNENVVGKGPAENNQNIIKLRLRPPPLPTRAPSIPLAFLRGFFVLLCSICRYCSTAICTEVPGKKKKKTTRRDYSIDKLRESMRHRCVYTTEKRINNLCALPKIK